jgi:hypothetical protein
MRWVWLTLKSEIFLSIPLQVFSLLTIWQQKEFESGHLIKCGSNLWAQFEAKLNLLEGIRISLNQYKKNISCHSWVGPTYLPTFENWSVQQHKKKHFS